MKPLLANKQVVRNILAGRQTQDRRPIKGIPDDACSVTYHGNDYLTEELRNKVSWFIPSGGDMWPCNREDAIKPKYQVGDVLYCRERIDYRLEHSNFYYHADNKGVGHEIYRKLYGRFQGRKKAIPSIHMPKEAARIFLKVTGVRVEMIRDISVEDARAEGVCPEFALLNCYTQQQGDLILDRFRSLWNSIYPGSWERNDWVFVYDFEICEKPKL